MIPRALELPTDSHGFDIPPCGDNDVLNDKIEHMLQETCEALSYAWYLSRSAADVEMQPDHAAYLSSLSDNIKVLHERIMADLLDRARPMDQTGSSTRR